MVVMFTDADGIDSVLQAFDKAMGKLNLVSPRPRRLGPTRTNQSRQGQTCYHVPAHHGWLRHPR